MSLDDYDKCHYNDTIRVKLEIRNNSEEKYFIFDTDYSSKPPWISKEFKQIGFELDGYFDPAIGYATTRRLRLIKEGEKIRFNLCIAAKDVPMIGDRDVSSYDCSIDFGYFKYDPKFMVYTEPGSEYDLDLLDAHRSVQLGEISICFTMKKQDK